MENDDQAQSSSTVKLLRPEKFQLSFYWRLLHSFLNIFGGIMFFLGSAQYYPSKNKELRGSAMFVLGSCCFFSAEWIDIYVAFTHAAAENLELTKLSDNKAVSNIESGVKDSTEQSLTRSPFMSDEILNLFLAVLGSLNYLLGCILFIPLLEVMTIGDYLFISGSVVIMISQSWKVWRAGCRAPTPAQDSSTETTPSHSNKTAFSLSNILAGNIPMTIGALSMGVGALTFLIGSILMLPQYETSVLITDIAVDFFLIGSALFANTGFCICYNHFFWGKSSSTGVCGGNQCWDCGAQSKDHAKSLEDVGL